MTNVKAQISSASWRIGFWHLKLLKMFGYFLRHAFQYLLLLLILGAGILTLFLIPNYTIKLTVVFALTSLYLLWAIWHHWEERNLTPSLLLEYLAVAGLILWVLVSII